MSEPEATATANGSAPARDTSGETVPEKKDLEEKENVEEKMDAEEKEDVEEKDTKENGVKTIENDEEVKEEKEKECVSTVEGENAKMKEAECVKEEDKEKEGKEGKTDEVEEGEGEKEGGEGKTDAMEEGDDAKEQIGAVEIESKIKVKKEANGLSRKRARGKKAGKEGGAKGVKHAGTKERELLRTPVASSTERPVRERKSVERLVEVIEKGPSTHFKIEKGRGTPLKDIPNVAYKLARKKPADLKLLHQMLFGRRGKVVNFRSNILQFSGFVWHENEEKQRARVKEKLDKCVKDTLVDLCDLFDIPVAKATTRKEDLVAKLLDFMAAPHATTDVILSEKEQQSAKSRKRKRVAKGSTSKSLGSTPVERSRKRRRKPEGTPKAKEKNVDEMEDDEEEEEEEENGAPEEDDECKHSESDANESESQEEAKEDDEIPDKGKRNIKKSSKQGSSSSKEKVKARTSPKKVSIPMTTKSPSKRSSSKITKAEESVDVQAKVFSRKKDVDSPKKKATPKSDSKEKPTGKKGAKVKAKVEDSKDSGPSQKQLREKICEILKEVDFNTATFTDILKQLATHYKTDLTPRKKSIKLMIQEELTKLADEEENEDEEEDEGGAEDENQDTTMGEEVEA